jgi:hypothetical protein
MTDLLTNTISSMSQPTTDLQVIALPPPVQCPKPVPTMANLPPLLKLAPEIKQMILTFAVTVDEPIEPVQLRAKSNKFVWSVSQIEKDKNDHSKKVSAAPQLAAVQLSKVCKGLYNDVAGTKLFYKVSHFKFSSSLNSAITYLVAVTPDRMKAIRSISIPWSYWGFERSHIFTMITAIEGLQELELMMSYNFCGYLRPKGAQPDLLPGFQQLERAVQGLHSLSVTVSDIQQNSWTGQQQWAIQSHKETQILAAKAQADLSMHLGGKPRVTKYSLAQFRRAQAASGLDVHGDGRLGDDVRPGVVASRYFHSLPISKCYWEISLTSCRTRQQKRNLENIDADGVVPERPCSKYDEEGHINWRVQEVSGCRESKSAGGSIEFRVKLMPLTSRRRGSSLRNELPEVAWEDLSALASDGARNQILEFYRKSPNACGKELVIDAWKLHSKRDWHMIQVWIASPMSGST